MGPMPVKPRDNSGRAGIKAHKDLACPAVSLSSVMVVLGTTIHEFRWADRALAGKLVDPRAKHEDDGVFVNAVGRRMPTWDPNQYLKFTDHRLRPALDLLAQIPLADPRSVYDLGCGPGNITRLLAERWPNARVVGIDSSADMLTKARMESSSVAFEQADIAHWSPPAPADLLFTNATLALARRSRRAAAAPRRAAGAGRRARDPDAGQPHLALASADG